MKLLTLRKKSVRSNKKKTVSFGQGNSGENRLQHTEKLTVNL